MLVSSVGGGGRQIPVYHWLVFGEENPLLDLLELVLGGKPTGVSNRVGCESALGTSVRDWFGHPY